MSFDKRARAEAEYRASFRALSLIIGGLELPALHRALAKFIAASNQLALTRPTRTGMAVVIQRELPETGCLSCGSPVPPKGLRDKGPQRLYCSHRCSARESMRHYRDKLRARAAEQAEQVSA